MDLITNNTGSNKMKIITASIPQDHINKVDKLINENVLYSSRSELIRCAVKEFLVKSLRLISQPSDNNNKKQ